MSVGSKIKILRKKRGMTQSALAENIVSRGMLSRIENGSAEPSMNTLKALADRLEISPGFLLESGDDVLPAERARYAKLIFEHFGAGNFRTCLDLFTQTDFSENDTFVGIYAQCLFLVAVDDFNSGNFSSSKANLKKAEQAFPRLNLLSDFISPSRIEFLMTVMDNVENIENIPEAVLNPPDFSFQPSLFLFLLSLLRDGRHNDCMLFLEFCKIDSFYSDFIKAQILFNDYKFIDALLLMKSLTSDTGVPFFLKLLCYRGMENCCKLCEDYKGAYENHLKYSSLLEEIK